LKPLETALIRLDFRDIPQGFKYNEHYAIIVLGRDAEEGQSVVVTAQDLEPWRIEHEQGLK
jgi:hypothetical protein